MATDPMAALAAVSGEGATKKKKKESGVLELDATPVQDAVDKWAKAKAMMDEAKAVKDVTEVQIQAYVQPLLTKTCAKEGAVHQSASVDTVRLTWKRGSQMFAKSSLNSAALRNSLGDELYETMFNEVQGSFQLTEAATGNDAFIAALVKLVKEHGNGQVLMTREVKVEPKDTLYDMRVLQPVKYAEVKAKLDVAGVKDQKPSFGLKT